MIGCARTSFERWVPSQLETAAIFYHQTDPATARWLGEQTLGMPVHVAERYFAQLAGIDFRHRINDVDLPVLAMWGMHDQLIDPQWADWFDKRDLPAGGSSGSSTAATVRWSMSRRGWRTCFEPS